MKDCGSGSSVAIRGIKPPFKVHNICEYKKWGGCMKKSINSTDDKKMKAKDKEIIEDNNFPRTDLAVELKENMKPGRKKITGLHYDEHKKEYDIKVTTVIIEDENASKIMHKPVGTYITIETKYLDEDIEDVRKSLIKEIAFNIDKVSKGFENKSILIIGLGNKDITPDKLGPMVVDNLYITRHLFLDKEECFGDNKNKMPIVSALSPGVMAQTGMETSEIVASVVKKTKPDLVIAIDALAARSLGRLINTVQIADTGITPGSGVGNHRNAITYETVGVPVVAIGVPTVVDATTIVKDTMTKYLNTWDFEIGEINTFVNEIDIESETGLIVTPKNIDEQIKLISFAVAQAINMCIGEVDN